MFNVLIVLVGLLGPFVVWAGVFAARKQRAFELVSIFRLLRLWRWISWIIAVVLWLCYLLPFHLPWIYGGSATTFSLGLSFPELSLKTTLRTSAPIGAESGKEA